MATKNLGLEKPQLSDFEGTAFDIAADYAEALEKWGDELVKRVEAVVKAARHMRDAIKEDYLPTKAGMLYQDLDEALTAYESNETKKPE
jgi:hypothetical protein